MKTVLILILSIVAICKAQSVPELTGGLPNGRAWKTFTANQKLIFIAGYVTGISHGSTLAKAMESADERKDSLYSDFIFQTALSKTMNNQERSDALDRFYDTPENASIAIPDALEVISSRASGATEATIKQMIADLLKGLAR